MLGDIQTQNSAVSLYCVVLVWDLVSASALLDQGILKVRGFELSWKYVSKIPASCMLRKCTYWGSGGNRGAEIPLATHKTKSEEHTKEEKPDTEKAEENIKTNKLPSEGKC